jgi:hypothetical protein
MNPSLRVFEVLAIQITGFKHAWVFKNELANRLIMVAEIRRLAVQMSRICRATQTLVNRGRAIPATNFHGLAVKPPKFVKPFKQNFEIPVLFGGKRVERVAPH